MNNLNLILKLVIIFCALQSTCYANFQKGVEFFDMARYRDSIKAFKASIKNKEQVGNSYAYLGRIYYRGREYERAYKVFLRAVKYGSNSERLMEDLSRCMDKLRGLMELPDFIKLYEDTYKNGIHAIPVIYYVINNHHKRGEYSEILKVYQKIKKSPSFQLSQKTAAQSMSSICFQVATSYLNHLDDKALALQFAAKSIRFDPLNEAGKKLHKRLLEAQQKKLAKLLKKANKHFIDRNFDSAQDTYGQILEIKPNHTEASSGIETCKLARNSFQSLDEARDLLEQNRHEAALKKIKYALLAYPDNYEAKNLKKEIDAKILKKANIKIQKEEARKEREKRYFSLLSQATNLINSNLYDDAFELLDEANRLRPNSKRLSSILLNAKTKRKHFEEYQAAIKSFEAEKWQISLTGFLKVKDTGLNFSDLDSFIIECFYRLSKYEEAITRAKAYLNVFTDNREILYFLARSHEALIPQNEDNRESAMQTYKKLIGIEKNFLDSQNRLARLQRDKWVPIIFVVLIISIFITLFIWLYKTRKIRAKYAYMTKVDKLLNSSNYQELAVIFEDFFKIDFTMKETLKYIPNFMLAMVETGRFDQCLDLGPKVLGVMPEHRQVNVLMGRAHYQKGKIDPSSIKFYLALLDSEYITDEIISWAGHKILELDINKKKSLPILKAFNAIYPENAECRKILIEYLDKEKIITPQLLKMLEMEIQYNESDTRCRIRLAEHYLKRKKLDECIKLCEEVINLDINDKKLHPILYSAYEAMNNLTALKPLYDSLLQLYPNSITLQEAQNKIAIATAQSEKSKTDLNSYRNNEEDNSESSES